MKFRRNPVAGSSRSQGYVLLTLMLFVALMAIAATAIAPSITFQIQRDREEELVHRGTQYSRAIRRYYKKFGRYPTRIEDLENTNNVRFLRRRYKDPITGQDFKILHYGDVQMAGGVGIAGAMPAAAMSAMGGIPAGLGAGALNAAQTAQAAAAMVAMQSGMASGFGGGQSASPFASLQASQQPSQSSPLSSVQQSSLQQSSQSPQDAGASGSQNGSGGGDSSSNGSNGSGSTSGTQPGQGSSSSGDKLSGQVFGGGPIVGVTSASKKTTIREYNHKNHYNQWQFIYDPTLDRGALITTPAQPPLQVTVQNGQPASTMGAAGATPNSGTSSGFGSFGGGFGGQSGAPAQPTPAPQPAQPQQQ